MTFATDLARLTTPQIVVVVLILAAVALVTGVALRRGAATRRHALALQESVKMYKGIADETPAMLCRTLPSTEIAFANRAYCEYFGKSLEELAGTSFLLLILEPDREGVTAELAKLTPDSPVMSHEQRVLRANGEIAWQRWTNRMLFDDAGETLYLATVGEDITDERQRISDLAQGRIETDALRRAVPLGVGVVVDRVFHQVNDRFCTMVGYRRDELIDRSAKMVYPSDEEFERVGREKHAQIGRTGVGTVETRFRCKDGRLIDVLLSSAAHDPNDLGRGLTFSVLDITDRLRIEDAIRDLNQALETRVAERTKELEQRVAEVERLNRGILNLADDLHSTNADLEEAAHRLEAANNELEAFAYSVSHDLRAPLRHICGFADLLVGSTTASLGEIDRHHLRRIVESAARMGALIDDLLEFSRTGRVELLMAPTDLTLLTAAVVKEARGRAEKRRISWIIGDLPVVRVDQTTMRQVLANLVDNAVKYTGKTALARIEIGQAPDLGEEMVFFVRDNGVGFDPRYAHKLFGVFQRLHRADEFEGTGIGLANVRRIINRHGGRTWAEGAVGEGATIFFSLPRRDEPGISDQHQATGYNRGRSS